MTKAKSVDNYKLEAFLKEKREEIIWALSLQDYTDAQIARMFKLNRSTVLRMLRDKPKDYQAKWVKRI